MGRGGVFGAQDRGRVGRSVSAKLLGAPDLGLGDEGGRVALPCPDGNGIDRDLHDALDDPRGLSHDLDLARRLDSAHPVDEQIDVNETGVRQRVRQDIKVARGEKVCVALVPDPGLPEPMVREHRRHVLHRMLDA